MPSRKEERSSAYEPKEDSKKGVLSRIYHSAKHFLTGDFLNGGQQYIRVNTQSKGERAVDALSLLSGYSARAAKRIEDFTSEYREKRISKEDFDKLKGKEKAAIKKLEAIVTDSLAVILILGAIFLFSFSKDTITGYSIYTATSSLNYAVLSGVFLLLTSIFLIIKTHK